jgi:hypothetical protein
MTATSRTSVADVSDTEASLNGNRLNLELRTPARLWTRIVVSFRAKWKFQVPIGHEDEAGFHLGEPPARDGIHWPPV